VLAGTPSAGQRKPSSAVPEARPETPEAAAGVQFSVEPAVSWGGSPLAAFGGFASVGVVAAKLQ